MEKKRYIQEAEDIIYTSEEVHDLSYHMPKDPIEQHKLAEEVWRKIDRSQNVIASFQLKTEQSFGIGGDSFMATIPGEGRPHIIRIYPTQLNAIRRMSDRQEQYIKALFNDK